MKKLAILVFATVLFSSCSEKAFLTGSILATVKESNIPLNKIQFYNDNGLILEREMSSTDANVKAGALVFKNGKSINRVSLEKQTPGALLKEEGDKLYVSFDNPAKESNSLIFAPIVGERGEYFYQLVDENKRAYHAGVSAWRADKNLNDTSIGIEIVNTGYTTDASGKRVFAPFDEAQIRKVAALVKDIVNRYQIPATNILAHSDIAPTRKQDPGPLFPWKRLYDEYQIGMWYDEAAKQSFYDLAVSTDFPSKYNDSTFIFNVQTQLQKFGYGLDLSGKWDDATKKTIEAFQYHFRPQNYDGILDPETFAILQALIQKYPVK